MEFDSIIYIVIAIGLAIINAIAQKKKKAGAAKKISSPEEIDRQIESLDNEFVPDFHPIEEQLSKDPFEILFGNDDFRGARVPVEVPEEKPIEVIKEQKSQHIESYSDYQLKMQERAEELLSSDYGTNTFDFEEDSIASTAITDALTEEEEELATSEGRSDFLKSFDAKTAIIYSEVIKPKYFSVRVNS